MNILIFFKDLRWKQISDAHRFRLLSGIHLPLSNLLPHISSSLFTFSFPSCFLLPSPLCFLDFNYFQHSFFIWSFSLITGFPHFPQKFFLFLFLSPFYVSTSMFPIKNGPFPFLPLPLSLFYFKYGISMCRCIILQISKFVSVINKSV